MLRLTIGILTMSCKNPVSLKSLKPSHLGKVHLFARSISYKKGVYILKWDE